MREHITLSDVIDELTPEQVRRIVRILRLAEPRPQASAPVDDTAA